MKEEGREYRVYGPPGCIAGDTLIPIRRGRRNSSRFYQISEVYARLSNNGDIEGRSARKWDMNIPTTTMCLMGDIIGYHEIDNVLYSGEQVIYEVITEGGNTICATQIHPFKVPEWQPGQNKEGFTQLRDLSPGKSVLCRNLSVKANGRNFNERKHRKEVCVKRHPYGNTKIIEEKYEYKRLNYARIVVEAVINGLNVDDYIKILNNYSSSHKKITFLPPHLVVHHKDFDPSHDHTNNLEIMTKEEHDFLHGKHNQRNFKNVIPDEDRIVSILEKGKVPTYDIVMKPPFHNFIAENFIVHNTGKTTYLMGKIGNVSTKGYAQDLLVSSFTRTAAKELVDRAKKQFGEQMPVPEHQIGTLHAHCFHLLERPQIAEDKKHIKEWNKENPELELSGSDTGIDESHLDSTPTTNADGYLSEYNINRNRMIRRDLWNPSVLTFAEKWERFKWMNNLRDFTDLIEETITDIPEPPYGCRIGIFDEVQDFTPLQLKLIRSWAKYMEYILISGDDDQAIYLFSGATPEAFNNPPIDDSRKTILDQSYRVPAKVQRLANKIIYNVFSREPKEYKPRQEEGEITIRTNINYKSPEMMGKIIEKEIDQETRSDNRIMIMATCSYMLTKTTKFLKDEGIPFHNPYRVTRADWNPLSNSGRGMSTKDRIREFLNPQGPVFGGITLWSIKQLQAWIELIKIQDVLNTGYKQKIIDAAKQENMDLDDQLDLYKEAFRPEALEAAVKKDPGWLAYAAVSSKKKKVNELAAFLSHDPDVLDKRPKIVVGTVHSFKGGQADVVILFPDLSLQAARPYNDKVSCREGYDSVMRQMYVAVTRTFEKLYIAHPVSKKLCFKELFR